MTPDKKVDISNIKKKIIISMCAIILLFLTLFGITYAYFTTKIQGNKNTTSIEVSAAKLKLEYNGENSYIKVEGLYPGESIESKIFSVRNTGTVTIKNYDVILENLVNELSMYEDLTYELTCESSDGKDCNGNSGIFPRMNQVIATNTIDPEVKHSYVLTLTYKETNTNQSIDMNKTISAKVNIKDDYSDIKKFNIYGNTLLSDVQSLSLTQKNEIKSFGELVTNENDNNFGKYRIPFNIYEKNLFDFSKNKNYLGWCYGCIEDDILNGIKLTSTTTASSKYESYISYIINSEDILGKTITVSADFKLSEGNTAMFRFGYWDKNSNKFESPGQTYVTIKENGRYSITVDVPKVKPEIVKEYAIFFNASILEDSNGKIVEITNVQVEYGDNATKYEKYQEPKTYYIYLNEPLRKLGSASDYIDLENKIVVRRVAEKVFDGTENILNYENGLYYGLLHDYNIPAVSNYYSNNIEDVMHFTSTKNSNAIHFRIDETVDEFKSILKENYDSGQPLKVIYALQSDVYEAINVPDLKASSINMIKSCDINNICASNIEVEFDE